MANIWNTGRVNDYLSQIADGDEALLAHLKTAIAKPLLKLESCSHEITELPEDAPKWLQDKWDTGGPWHEWRPSSGLDAKVNHIKDWIKGAMYNEAEWISHADPKGRPHKLMAISTLDQATVCADRAMHTLSIKFRSVAEEEGDTNVVKELGDGYALVELLTPDALKRESGMMGHCIGDGGHDEHLEEGKRKFYSLRDSNNNAHVTFDIDEEEGKLVECKGKGNAPPIDKYMPFVKAYIVERGLTVEETPDNIGLITIDGELHDITQLPDNLTLTGKQFINLMAASQTVFPETVKVEGDLDFAASEQDILAQTAPKNLEVTGSVTIANKRGVCPYIADNLVVNEDFAFEGITDARLPSESLHIERRSSFKDSDMAELPPKTYLGEFADFSYSGLEHFPPSFIAKGGCDIEGNKMTVITDGAQILGELDTGKDSAGDESQITRVGSKVTLQESSFARMGLPISGAPHLTIIGDVNHATLRDVALPDNLTVLGDLDLSGADKITELPENLYVEGDLNLLTSPIREIPESLTCSGTIILPDGIPCSSVEKARKLMATIDERYTPLTDAEQFARNSKVMDGIRQQEDEEEEHALRQQWDPRAGVGGDTNDLFDEDGEPRDHEGEEPDDDEEYGAPYYEDLDERDRFSEAHDMTDDYDM